MKKTLVFALVALVSLFIVSSALAWNCPYDVVEIQTALIEEGFDIEADGYYGPKTKEAVRAFQEANGLEIDGYVGEETAGVLGILPLETMNVSESQSIDPSAYSSKTNHLIMVSLEEKTVRIYTLSNGVWQLHRKYACAVGKKSSPTPTGVFEIRHKTDGFKKGSYEYRHYTTFEGEYGFHSVGVKNGRSSNRVLGTACTHGCIRLTESDALELQSMCQHGTTVVIY